MIRELVGGVANGVGSAEDDSRIIEHAKNIPLPLTRVFLVRLIVKSLYILVETGFFATSLSGCLDAWPS